MPPPPSKPLRCGVIVYLHIPKTGGSSVSRFLLQHATGGHGWWQASVTEKTSWPAIVESIRQRKRPKQIIMHHVDSPMAMSDEVLINTVVKPLDCWLRSQGCRLVLTTTLREASARASSAAYYNSVAHSRYAGWVSEHASDGMVSFLLHNRVRIQTHNRSVQMKPLDLRRAQCLLSEFDAVGRTEELEMFLTYLHALIGGEMGNSTAGGHRVNDTPDSQKYQLTAEERAWTSARTQLDGQLYASLCGGLHSCTLRNVTPASAAADARALQCAPWRVGSRVGWSGWSRSCGETRDPDKG